MMPPDHKPDDTVSYTVLMRLASADEGSLSRILIWIIGTLSLIFALWISFFQIDIRAKGSGKVVPVSQVQQIQSLEGGIVQEILVHEGDFVQKDQIIVRLSPSLAQGELREKQATAESLGASIARLEAEAEGRTPAYPENIRQEHPEIIETEENLRRERAQSLEAQLQVIRMQRAQKYSEISDHQARLPQARASLALLRKQIATMEPLVAKGAVAPLEIVNLRREEANTINQVTSIESGATTARAAAAEADRKIAERQATFATEARDELAKRKTQLASLSGGISSKQDQLNRTTVVSPVNGIIKTLYISTIGGVTPPGRTIVEIVPIEDTLLIEAKFPPNEIAWIRAGQPANVRITAFEQTNYSGLEGEVISISPDSQLDERKDQIYYKVKIRTKQGGIDLPTGRLSIVPGMVADVDVLTGQRSVLAYLTKPIVRGLTSALSER